MYLVTFQNHTEQKFSSVAKAVEAIENDFQCGTKQELKQIKKSLRCADMVQVQHCMSDSCVCWIEKI
tara:strand:- start:104 stop:304 length:201 start_codon:yes stop_codon:yes gene_type:complete